jgi:hypothetical protein
MVMSVPSVMRVPVRVVVMRARWMRMPMRMRVVVVRSTDVLHAALVHVGVAFLAGIGEANSPSRHGTK